MGKSGLESRVAASARQDVARAVCRILGYRMPGVLWFPGIPDRNEKAPGGAASTPRDLRDVTAPADAELLAERLHSRVSASDERRDLVNALVRTAWSAALVAPKRHRQRARRVNDDRLRPGGRRCDRYLRARSDVLCPVLLGGASIFGIPRAA
jgi:hypothetical protein